MKIVTNWPKCVLANKLVIIWPDLNLIWQNHQRVNTSLDNWIFRVRYHNQLNRRHIRRYQLSVIYAHLLLVEESTSLKKVKTVLNPFDISVWPIRVLVARYMYHERLTDACRIFWNSSIRNIINNNKFYRFYSYLFFSFFVFPSKVCKKSHIVKLITQK